MKCNKNHLLKKCVGMPPNYTGVLCDICMDTDLENMDSFFNCLGCQFDVCKECYEQKTQFETYEQITIWKCPECSYPNRFNQESSQCTNKKCVFTLEDAQDEDWPTMWLEFTAD